MQTKQSPPVIATQYKLPEADRKAILATTSSFSKKTKKIESQRLRFVELNGDDFGQKYQQKNSN